MSYPECSWLQRFEAEHADRAAREIVLESDGDKEFISAAGLEYVEIVSADAVGPIYVVACPDFLPQLEVDWLIVQPASFRENPFNGWEPVQSTHQTFLGSDELTVIQFKPTDNPETLCSISTEGERGFTIVSFTDRGPLKLIRVAEANGGEAEPG